MKPSVDLYYLHEPDVNAKIIVFVCFVRIRWIITKSRLTADGATYFHTSKFPFNLIW